MQGIDGDTRVEYVGNVDVIQGCVSGLEMHDDGTSDLKVSWEDGHESWIQLDTEGTPVRHEEFRIAA